MNVTLGVPRIKEIGDSWGVEAACSECDACEEIINAAKTICTPIITCTLRDEFNEVG